MRKSVEKDLLAPGDQRDCKVCYAEVLVGEKTERQMRPAKFKGPRCHTHYYAFKKAQKKREQDRKIEKGFGLTPEQYDQLYKEQGGKCYICQIATGKVRRLAVDHDHRCCPGPVSCGICVRGLACGQCNHDVLPRVGDRPEDWRRVADILEATRERIKIKRENRQ